ncbi:MAG: SIS domain-containing protein [Desulfobacula sp.]|nr:SIS domain-containing protein [Desulfobacula sp.]
MCGIVVYYGDAENRLNRVLTGMWAIVYRAPDSTGIGLIGSDLETLKIRRELGSVDNLIDRLMTFPVFDEGELRVVSIMDEAFHKKSDFMAQNQKKLLAFEGFLPHENQKESIETRSFPRWSDLTDTQNVLQVEPGTAGNPEIQEYFKIDSPKMFKATIDRLVVDFDLSVTVVEKLMRMGFETQVRNKRDNVPAPIEESDLFHEFKLIFDRYADYESPVQPRRMAYKPGQKNPYARKYVWQYLRDVVVTMPSDYTTDGIANLFRSIDSSVLANSIHNPEIDDRVQLIFENFWTINKTTPPVHWRTLYRTERIYNVYGIAAASALAYFQTEIYMKNMLGKGEKGHLPPGHIPGRSHPLLLKYMVQPVIAQGRWAIQSSISVRNAHPFIDEKKIRAVVLNGQFSSDIESRIRNYLTQVAKIKLRSNNSTELFVMLWGYYFDTAYMASQRYKVIEKQHDLGLEDVSVCSQSIDYGIFKTLNNKTIHDIDELSFIRAMEVMVRSGGQFAVCGISIVSTDRLFIAAHKRPLYVVKRPATSDFMVVSDINAALGLFPQTLIRSASIKLQKLMKAYSKKSVIVEPIFFDDDSNTRESWFRREKMSILTPFQVDIYALDQEQIFAKIQTKAGTDNVLRKLEIRDFSGKIRTDIQPEQTYLTPITFKKDFGKTFYEEHLFEIPGLITDVLNRYTCPDRHIPKLDIKKRLLERRFGAGLASLNRIILVSTGFSYLLAEIVEKTMEQFLTGINIIVATPLDFDTVENSINPDRDLVVMISWSGTTSDMIDFASGLLKKNILMVGITEKPFSDMALIVRKSAGIIPVFSGEEVTVAALKSAICMLLTLDLFCLYICGLTSETEEKVAGLVSEMEKISEKIDTLLFDEEVVEFCREVTIQTLNASSHCIIDALYDIGSAKMGSLNLELNAWTSMGNAIDYSELDEFIQRPLADDDLLLVNATNTRRLDKGVDFMAALHKAGKRFFAVSTKNREKKEIQKYAEKAVFLPQLPDYFQPFIDLPFMFLFGFYFGLARGRLSGQMPRNMAKSVTAGRTKGINNRSVSDILDDMDIKNKVFTGLPDSLLSKAGTPCWITLARNDIEKKYYSDLIKLCAAFHDPDPFSTLFSTPTKDRLEILSTLIFEHLEEDGIIIFVPLDKRAEAGCRNFIRLWELFFNTPLQVEFPEKLKGVSTEDSLVVTVASEPPDKEKLSAVSQYSHKNLLLIGPEKEGKAYQAFSESFGTYIFSNPDLSCQYEQVYFALSLFFSKVMSYQFPNRSRQMNDHFKFFLPAVNTILGDQALRQTLQKVITENQAYKKRLFITSLRGNCTIWKNEFREHKTHKFESETFGVSAYSHLVMVDPLVNEKYIKLEPRDLMEKCYSQKDICAWENRYLGGESVDAFLKKPSMHFQTDSVLPFIFEDKWYLPVLKSEFDKDRDCLVIIDATSETYFDSALDELATFGSRYARLVIVTQEGFSADAKLSTLKKYPLSHIVLVPGIKVQGTKIEVMSDYILPVIINIIGSALKSLDQ